MIIDEETWRDAVVPEHDHVLITAPDDGHIWKCAFCSFGLSDEEMPGHVEPDWREAAEYGPGEPIVDRSGRVRGHQWFSQPALGVLDEAMILSPEAGRRGFLDVARGA